MTVKVGLFTNHSLYDTLTLCLCVQNSKNDMFIIIMYIYLNIHYMLHLYYIFYRITFHLYYKLYTYLKYITVFLFMCVYVEGERVIFLNSSASHCFDWWPLRTAELLQLIGVHRSTCLWHDNFLPLQVFFYLNLSLWAYVCTPLYRTF